MTFYSAIFPTLWYRDSERTQEQNENEVNIHIECKEATIPKVGVSAY